MPTLTKSTKPVKAADIKRDWHLFDAKDEILGRLCSQIAQHLVGKNKRNYVPYLDMGDHVVVINADQVKLSGKKEQNKIYTRYSGYPSGLRRETAGELRERRPTELVRRGVYGMIPKNKLRDQRMARLHIFTGEEHPYQDKLKSQKDKS